MKQETTHFFHQHMRIKVHTKSGKQDAVCVNCPVRSTTNVKTKLSHHVKHRYWMNERGAKGILLSYFGAFAFIFMLMIIIIISEICNLT